MGSLAVIVIVACIAVGVLVLGMSLTLIFKGHHIRSEIGDNPDMQKLGLKCTAQEMRRMELGYSLGECGDFPGCGSGECGSCNQNNK